MEERFSDLWINGRMDKERNSSAITISIWSIILSSNRVEMTKIPRLSEVCSRGPLGCYLVHTWRGSMDLVITPSIGISFILTKNDGKTRKKFVICTKHIDTGICFGYNTVAFAISRIFSFFVCGDIIKHSFHILRDACDFF